MVPPVLKARYCTLISSAAQGVQTDISAWPVIMPSSALSTALQALAAKPQGAQQSVKVIALNSQRNSTNRAS
jgi:hypothetical protein